jgi:hypothetical protein
MTVVVMTGLLFAAKNFCRIEVRGLKRRHGARNQRHHDEVASAKGKGERLDADIEELDFELSLDDRP